MKNNNTTEVIEKYLNGTLNPEERTAFEKKLQSDPQLAQQTSSYRSFFVDNIYLGKDKIRRGIQAVGQKGTSFGKSIISTEQKKNVVKAISIMVILLICLTSIFFLLENKPDHEDLFTQYYSTYISSHPSVGEDLEETYGITYFQKREFSRAIPALEKEIIAKPGEARLYLFLGLSYLETDIDEKAAKNFEMAESLSEGNARNSAIWYLALTQVKMNHLPEAKANLKELIKKSDNNEYKINASELLRSL